MTSKNFRAGQHVFCAWDAGMKSSRWTPGLRAALATFTFHAVVFGPPPLPEYDGILSLYLSNLHGRVLSELRQLHPRRPSRPVCTVIIGLICLSLS